jgi:hypothetical protein
MLLYRSSQFCWFADIPPAAVGDLSHCSEIRQMDYSCATDGENNLVSLNFV